MTAATQIDETTELTQGHTETDAEFWALMKEMSCAGCPPPGTTTSQECAAKKAEETKKAAEAKAEAEKPKQVINYHIYAPNDCSQKSPEEKKKEDEEKAKKEAEAAKKKAEDDVKVKAAVKAFRASVAPKA